MITQGENGVPIPFTAYNDGVLNLTGATVEVDVKRADGTTFIKVAEILDAVNGKCRFVLSSTDLSVPGTYEYQWVAYFESGNIKSIRKADFYVYESMRATSSGEVTDTPIIPFVRVTEFETVKADVEDLKLNGGGGGGSVPSNVILFEDWTDGETVTIDTSTAPTNTAPSVSSTFNLTSANDSTSISIPYSISDAQGGNMTVTLTKDGVSSTQTVQTGANTWSVGTLAVGAHTLKIKVTDSGGLSSNELTFNLTVTATETPTTNTAPSITSSYNTTSVNDSTSVSIPYTVTDAEGGSFTVTYTKDGVTSTATISAGANTWNVGTLAAGAHVLKIKVVDSGGLSSSELTFSINVTATPDTTVPVLTITPAQTFTTQMTVNMSATDSGGGTPTIYYTLDDSDPKTSGTKLTYTGPITLTETDTVKAYAVDSSNNASAVQTVTYTKIVVDPNLLASDTFDKADRTGLGTTETGQTWGTGGGLDISGGVAKHNVLSTSMASDVIDIGVSDNYEISCDINSVSGTNIWGITVRALADGTGGRTFGGLVNGATLDKVGIYGVTATFKTGVNIAGTHTFKVRVQGSNLKCYVDDVLHVDYTETDSTKLSNTRVGLWCYNNTVNTFNNFKVTKIV